MKHTNTLRNRTVICKMGRPRKTEQTYPTGKVDKAKASKSKSNKGKQDEQLEPLEPIEQMQGGKKRKVVKREDKSDMLTYAFNRAHSANLPLIKNDEFNKTNPVLTVDQLKIIYVAGGNMTLEDMAERVNSLPADRKSNTKYANFVLAVAAIGRNADMSNIDDLRMRFYSYLELAQRCDMKVSNLCAYLSIGLTYERAYQQMKTGTDAVKDLLFEMQAVCGSYRETITGEGKLNPVTSIFWQKNYDGLKDRTEQTVTVQDPLGKAVDQDDIKKKYADIIME